MSDIDPMSDKTHENERAVQLLLLAVRKLPEADQDAVLALLLQGLTGNPTWERDVSMRDERGRITVALTGSAALRPGRPTIHESTTPRDSDAKIVPVRFPTQTHERLKAWCEEHRFPMAAVVRGLVERFLDSQELP